MDLIDTHAHLTFKGLAHDIANIVNRAAEAGVTRIVTVGTDPEDNEKALLAAKNFPNVFAAVGIHPHEAKHVTSSMVARLRELAADNNVVAIGETGFDFHYNLSPQKEQLRAFVEHINIAKNFNLPLIIHSREAFEETIETLDQYAHGFSRVVFHCFGGTVEQAKIILSKGYSISFTGVVTFKNADALREAAKAVPLHRLMIETDCPYMSPEPLRKQKTNEPALMVYTAKKLAEIKEISLEELTQQTTENATDFFALGRIQ